MIQQKILTALLLYATSISLSSSFVLRPTVSSSSTLPSTKVTATTSPFSSRTSLHATDNDDGVTTTAEVVEPQVFGTGYSSSPYLLSAVIEATNLALKSLPPSCTKVSLATVYISSLYDGSSSIGEGAADAKPSAVVPILLDQISQVSGGSIEVEHVIGCSAAGILGSNPVDDASSQQQKEDGKECIPVETEALPGVCVTLAVLPDVQLKTFHVMGDDIPEDLGMVSSDDWKNNVGLGNFDNGVDDEVFMLFPSPSFQNKVDKFLGGLSYAFPTSTTFGGVASTVSSLSRARLFRYSSINVGGTGQPETLTDGCVGAVLKGDIQVKVMVSQGAKPVGGIYRVVSGEGSTVGAIVLDEAATEEAQEGDEYVDDGEDDDDDEEVEEEDEKKRKNAEMAAAYAKARIPKPILAEANFIMRTLSDDDQAFMRRALLIGLERGGAMGRTPNELLRLAQGEGHRFTVHQVASAGMKDGSVTLPLGSVDIERGQRLRFFVRDGGFAKREVDALWMGYKKTCLQDLMMDGGDDDGESSTFTPSACMVMPTMDRGAKLFGTSKSGSKGYESSAVATFLPTVPSISGFYSNAVLGKLDENSANGELMVHGSSSCYAIFGSSEYVVFCRGEKRLNKSVFALL